MKNKLLSLHLEINHPSLKRSLSIKRYKKGILETIEYKIKLEVAKSFSLCLPSNKRIKAIGKVVNSKRIKNNKRLYTQKKST